MDSIYTPLANPVLSVIDLFIFPLAVIKLSVYTNRPIILVIFTETGSSTNDGKHPVSLKAPLLGFGDKIIMLPEAI